MRARRRLEPLVEQHQLGRAAQADEPRQRPARAAVGREADRGVGHREARRLGREHDVGGDREAHPAAGRRAAHGADHRRVERGQRLDPGMELLASRRRRRARRRPASRMQLQVAADAEVLARAGEDHGADVARRAGPPPRRASAVASSQVERVARLGPVERDRRDPVADLERRPRSWLQHHLPGRPAAVDQLQRVGRLLEREAARRPAARRARPSISSSSAARDLADHLRLAARCRRPSRRRRRRCCSAAGG